MAKKKKRKSEKVYKAAVKKWRKKRDMEPEKVVLALIAHTKKTQGDILVEEGPIVVEAAICALALEFPEMGFEKWKIGGKLYPQLKVMM